MAGTHKYLSLDDTLLIPTEVTPISASTGSSDAHKVIETGDDGLLDPSLFPADIGGGVRNIVCTEDLAAGDFVNIYNSTGEKCRKADASVASAGKQAHGYVLNNFTSGDTAVVYPRGTNTALTGLTPGTTYVLSNATPGGFLALGSGPTTAGHLLQILGEAVAADAMDVDIDNGFIRG